MRESKAKEVGEKRERFCQWNIYHHNATVVVPSGWWLWLSPMVHMPAMSLRQTNPTLFSSKCILLNGILRLDAHVWDLSDVTCHTLPHLML